jgi:CBS domain containing-hemolysin-like protein
MIDRDNVLLFFFVVMLFFVCYSLLFVGAEKCIVEVYGIDLSMIAVI